MKSCCRSLIASIISCCCSCAVKEELKLLLGIFFNSFPLLDSCVLSSVFRLHFLFTKLKAAPFWVQSPQLIQNKNQKSSSSPTSIHHPHLYLMAPFCLQMVCIRESEVLLPLSTGCCPKVGGGGGVFLSVVSVRTRNPYRSHITGGEQRAAHSAQPVQKHSKTLNTNGNIASPMRISVKPS